MKPKLILIVLGLVVIPTAVLSFLANRALEGREDLLQYRLKTDAASAIQVVSKRVQSRFEDDMEHVCAVVSECLARGGGNADLEAAATRLRNSRGTINRVFLFMNPWGFVFPERGGEGTEAGIKYPAISSRLQTTDNRPQTVGNDVPAASSLDSLVSALRREIGLVGSTTNMIRLTVEDASYWFSVLPGRKNMYAGYEINQNEFTEQLLNTLMAASGDIFVLAAEGPGIAKTNEVLISDVFSERAESRVQRSDLAEEPVASGRLMKPFDYVNIKAFVMDPGKIRKAAELRYRLYAWGILLMAAGVCLGLWLVLREAAAEIRRARTRSDFVIGVSHDLRTPVSSMKMLAESLYLERVGSREQQKKFLQVIVRESERLSQLIERVLFFVRMDQNALLYRFSQVDIGSLVTSAVDAFKARTEAGGQGGSEKWRDGDAGTWGGNSGDVDCRPSTVDRKGEKTEVRRQKSEEPRTTDYRPQTIDHRPQATDMWKSAFGDGHSSVSLSVDPGIPSVLGDESSITQVMLNLLDNAVKYGKREAGRQNSGDRIQNSEDNPEATDQHPESSIQDPEAGIRNSALVIRHSGIAVTVRFVEDSFRHFVFMPRRQWVVILVRDNGMGIDRKEQRRIFHRFYRVPGTGDSNVSGVGLGLALCRHVAKAHGGWIEVESEPGKGSVFSVYLPISAKDK